MLGSFGNLRRNSLSANFRVSSLLLVRFYLCLSIRESIFMLLVNFFLNQESFPPCGAILVSMLSSNCLG